MEASSLPVTRGQSVPQSNDRIVALLQRANQGDRGAMIEVRAALDEQPTLWDQVGDAALQAQASLLALATGPNEVAREAMRRKLQRLKRELVGEQPSILERLLADRVAVCWLLLAHAESREAETLRSGSASLQVQEYQQRRSERAQRRYLAAVRALAQVRRLLTPMVQVNIAERQVNVTQAAGCPGLTTPSAVSALSADGLDDA